MKRFEIEPGSELDPPRRSETNDEADPWDHVNALDTNQREVAFAIVFSALGVPDRFGDGPAKEHPSAEQGRAAKLTLDELKAKGVKIE